MPTVGVASVPELDAAEALLELHWDSREILSNRPVGVSRPHLGFRNEMESSATAALSLSRLNGSQATTISNSTLPGPSTPIVIQVNNGYIIRNNTKKTHKHIEPKYKKQSSHEENQKGPTYWFKAEGTPKVQGTKQTCEQATQTEIEYQLPQIEKMESIITELCEKIKFLEERLQYKHDEPDNDANNRNTNVPKAGNNDIWFEYPCGNRTSYDRKVKTNTNMTPIEDSDVDSEEKTESEIKEEDMDISDDDYLSEEQDYSRVLRRNDVNASMDMVPIGDGNATVPSRLLRQLDWASYTSATRKLLTAVFSRRVLATHSLTGKPSPAFPDKPAKKKLDPALVNDIIQTVVERCRVPENVVRTSITTKCADESKMFRSRQQNKNKRRVSKKENIPPRSSDGSPHST